MPRKYHLGRPPAPEPEPDEFQRECMEIFQRAAMAFSLPRALGQLYGLLYATPEPLNLDQMIERLRGSRGGTFRHLRMLRDLGAVTGGIFKPNQRSEYFQAERNLRKLATAFIHTQIEPHLRNGDEHLERLRSKIAADGTPPAEFQRARYDQMARWHRFGADLLPLIKAFSDKF